MDEDEEWPDCGACGKPIPIDECGEPDDSGDGTGRGTCCWEPYSLHITDFHVRKPDEQSFGENLSSTKYTLEPNFSNMSRVELIEKILGTHNWDYLVENGYVREKS